MKTKVLFLVVASALVATSCCKTYQCKNNQTEIITGEVCAKSQSEANSLCNPDPSSSNIAIKK